VLVEAYATASTDPPRIDATAPSNSAPRVNERSPEAEVGGVLRAPACVGGSWMRATTALTRPADISGISASGPGAACGVSTPIVSPVRSIARHRSGPIPNACCLHVSHEAAQRQCSMPPLAGADHTAQLLFTTTSIAFALSEVSIRIRSATRGGSSNDDRGSIVAVVLGTAAGLLSALWFATAIDAATIPGRWVPFVVGLAMMWLGIAVRQWAVWTLGRFFTVVVRVADGQRVVDHGPYRWVRHPSYTGLLLTLVGLGVALGNWLSVLALAILPLAGLVVRIRVEEQALLDGLGEPYRQYASRRRRLVPGVW
jgi:protein-S-isoprenylcysteine O-methyltransferase Ste14